jgi:hypothetical protein
MHSHIVICESSDGVLPIRCEGCGRRVSVVLPIWIDDLAAISEAFLKNHAGCGGDIE